MACIHFMKRTHQAIFLALMMATMSLAGCFGGDDKGSDEDENPVETLDDWQVHFANTASDLPECNDDRDGWLYYVSADENFRVCTQFGWEIVDITGPSGADGTNGVDGQNGANGSNGSNGSNGTDGMDGQDGTSILINVVSSTACLNGGNTFEIGSDDDADGVLDVTEVGVTVDICNGADGQDGADGADGAQGPAGADGTNGTQGPAGADGTNGTDGADGNATLTVTTNLSSSSSNCWGDGGVQIDVGVDDNNNGVLDSSEIDDTTYICNGGDGVDGDSAYQIWLNNGNTGSEQDFLDSLEGSSGTNGTNGTDGQDGYDGSNGLNALVSMTPESAGSNCANGGTRIDVGVDDNSNGVLETSEIDQTQYVCDGGSSNSTMLTSISSPPSNMGCDAGGRVVSHGLDNGDGGGTYANGVLETGEIDSSTTFCSRFAIGMLKDIFSGTSGCLLYTSPSPRD